MPHAVTSLNALHNYNFVTVNQHLYPGETWLCATTLMHNENL